MLKFKLIGIFSICFMLGFMAFQCSDDDDDDDTILNALEDDTSLTTFTQAVNAANLDGKLDNDDQDYTVFAPTDSAFNALPAGVLDTLLAHPTDSLASLLNYHVASGQLPVSELKTRDTVQTIENGLKISVDTTSAGIIRLNGTALVIGNPIQTDNGIIYKINRVLTLP